MILVTTNPEELFAVKMTLCPAKQIRITTKFQIRKPEFRSYCPVHVLPAMPHDLCREIENIWRLT